MPEVVRRIAAELSIEPVTRVNFVPHYAEADIDRIAAHLRRQHQQGTPIGCASRVTPIQ